jgi:hypothetical protein
VRVLHHFRGILVVGWCALIATQAHAVQPDLSPDITTQNECKKIYFGGSASQIEVWMCIVLNGNVMLVTGDLFVVVANKTDDRQDISISCTSSFPRSMQFGSTTLSTGGLLMTVTGINKHDYYILETQLNYGDRQNWIAQSIDKCRWTIEVSNGSEDQPRVSLPDIPLIVTTECRNKTGHTVPCTGQRQSGISGTDSAPQEPQSSPPEQPRKHSGPNKVAPAW